MLAGCHTQREIEALVLVHDVHRGRAGGGEPQLVLPQPLHLDPEACAVADDETEVADLRDVKARVIDLVDDSAADGEPQARVTERAADHFLGAAAPGRRQSGSSRRRGHRLTAARPPGVETHSARLRQALSLKLADKDPLGNAMASVYRKTEKGLPRYNDQDVFVLSGAEDLVLQFRTGTSTPDTLTRGPYAVHRYRPRTEGLFSRIEKWVDPSGDVHWRATTKDNVTSIFGRTAQARVFDSADSRRVYTWLLEETFDAKFGGIRSL